MQITLDNDQLNKCFVALTYLAQAINTSDFNNVIELKRTLKAKAYDVTDYLTEAGKKLNMIDAIGNISSNDPYKVEKFNELTKEFLSQENTFEIKPFPLSSLAGQTLNPANIELLMDAGIIV